MPTLHWFLNIWVYFRWIITAFSAGAIPWLIQSYPDLRILQPVPAGNHFGLEVLYSPGAIYNDAQGNATVDIVAVHGLNGHRYDTWIRKDNDRSVFWLKDLLPQRIPTARVMTFGYNARLVGSTSTKVITEQAVALLQELESKRSAVRQRPIVFIGHSMGGIVIKKAIQIAHTEDRYRPVSEHVNGIVFFGTPHQGMTDTDWEHMVTGMASVAFPFPRNGEFLKALSRNSKDIMAISEDFRPLAKEYSIVNYWEEDIILGFGDVVVPKHSAVLNVHSEVSSPLRGTHTTMCKFSGLEDERFDTVWKALQDVTSGRRYKDVQYPVHFMVPRPRNARYVETSRSISRLRDKLKQGKLGYQRLALWGVGGVGKSKEVLQLVHHYEHSRVSVFWIHAGNKIQFEQDYRKLYQLIKPPKQEEPVGDIRRIVKDWLESPESGDWILVLDNADNKLDFFPVQSNSLGQSDGLAKFIPNNPNGTVIVTTRDRDIADQLANKNVLHKEPMGMEEAGLLYFTYYPEAAEFTYDESILLLLNELHYIPLAIVHAASYLRLNPSTSPSRYLELLSSARDEQLRLLEPRKIGTFQQRYLSKSHNDVRRDASAGIVRATFSITFRQVDEQSPLASSLLKLMASVDYRSIPHELLARSELENSNNETALGEALNKLISYSLLVCTDSDDGKTYEMHPSIHQSGKESLSALEMATTVQRTAGALHGIISKSNFTMGNWSMWRVYLAHISALSRNVKTGSVQTARIHHYMSEYLLFVGRYHEAEDPCRRSAKLFTKFLGQEHPDTLTSIYNLAMIYQFQRQWKEAEEISVQLVETTKRVLGQEHSHTLTRMGNLASIYYMQGRMKEAEELEVHVVETSKRVLGLEDPLTLMSMNELALIYSHLGQLKKAEDLEVLAVETSKKVLGVGHRNTLFCMGNLASIYQSQERWKEAEELLVQVIEMNKKVLGVKHPNTLNNMANLAWTYRSQQRSKEAEELYVQVIETSKKVLGIEHPNTLNCMNNLAFTYWGQGQWKEAEELFEQVTETSKKVLGVEHPDTLNSMNNLAFTYWRQGRWKDAEELYGQVIEKSKNVRGVEHPNTLNSMNNLASTYRSQERWKEAEELEVQVIETSKKALGVEHPNTLNYMNNLAYTYWRQGRWKEAEEQYFQVLETTKTVHGQEHPQTLISMVNLATAHMNNGRWKEAEELIETVMHTRKKLLGLEHPDTLTAMNILAYVYMSQGRINEAQIVMAETATLRSRVLVKDHPDTKYSMDTLLSWKDKSRFGGN